MSETEIQGVKTAALLHDIGKLAVPEHILWKPGPLTQEEFQKIRIHPQVGAEIIGGVPFPYPVAPLILCHHERWDGNGYPAGLRGEEIPLGARILSVVDYFDALIIGAAAPAGDERRGRARSAAAGDAARRSTRRVVETFVAPVSQRSRPRRTPATRSTAAAQARRLPSRAAPPAASSASDRPVERVRRHRPRAPRDLRVVRDRAGDGQQSGCRRHDDPDRLEAEQPRAVLLLRAVPPRRRGRHPALPLRDRHRRRAHPAAHRCATARV